MGHFNLPTSHQFLGIDLSVSYQMQTCTTASAAVYKLTFADAGSLQKNRPGFHFDHLSIGNCCCGGYHYSKWCDE